MVGLDIRRARTYSLTHSACSGKVNATDTVIEQLLQQLTAIHILVADGKEETIANGLIDILVIDNTETVALQNFLYARSTLGILPDITHKVIFTVTRSLEHCRQCTLCRVRDTRRE